MVDGRRCKPGCVCMCMLDRPSAHTCLRLPTCLKKNVLVLNRGLMCGNDYASFSWHGNKYHQLEGPVSKSEALLSPMVKSTLLLGNRMDSFRHFKKSDERDRGFSRSDWAEVLIYTNKYKNSVSHLNSYFLPFTGHIWGTFSSHIQPGGFCVWQTRSCQLSLAQEIGS